MNNLPLVSIGIASYNNAKFIYDTLESIRKQTYPNIEIIIIDDCSTDNSKYVIQQWILDKNVNCKFIQNPVNLGATVTFNKLLKESKGVYISTIGSDDILAEDKLSIQAEILARSADDVAMVYSDVYVINENNNLINESLISTYGLNFKENPQGNVFLELLKNNFIPAMSYLIKRKCIEEINFIDENLAYEDWDTWLRIAVKYKILFSPFKSAFYRVHSSSAMQNRKAPYYESTLKSMSKFLGISPESDEIIKRHIIYYSELLFNQNGENSSYWLNERVKYDKGLSSYLYLLGSKFNISYQKIEKIKSLFK
jgi:glycosyltransferase involved in cell wall biosynthesis